MVSKIIRKNFEKLIDVVFLSFAPGDFWGVPVYIATVYLSGT